MATYTSEVQIGNEALVLLGEERIASFDDEGKAARTLKREYPNERDQLLESYNWKFAIARASLSSDSTDPAFGFSNRFLLPADCLRFLGLYSTFSRSNDPQVNYTGTDIHHKIEGRFLLLDENSSDSDNEALIFYIRAVTNPLEFAPLFGKALALSLAVKCCYDLTGSITRLNTLQAELDRVMKRARLMQAIQGTTEVVVASEWTDAHDGYWGSAWPGQRGWTG